jgi:hypothetical protein
MTAGIDRKRSVQMKNTKSFWGLAVLLLVIIALALMGCPNLSDPDPTVTSVTVSPKTPGVEQGGTQTFTATVSGTNNPAQTVT